MPADSMKFTLQDLHRALIDVAGNDGLRVYKFALLVGGVIIQEEGLAAAGFGFP